MSPSPPSVATVVAAAVPRDYVDTTKLREAHQAPRTPGLQLLTGRSTMKTSSIKIKPAAQGQTYPPSTILSMSPTHIRDLFFGTMTKLFIDNPSGGDPENFSMRLRFDNDKKAWSMTRSISIKSLMAVSPIIDEQIQSQVKDPNSITQLALPAASRGAYSFVFSWTEAVIRTGRITPVMTIFDRPLSKYCEVLELAQKLGISPIITNLSLRFEKMATYVPGGFWNLQVEDIRACYKGPEPNLALRHILIDSIASAWKNGGFRGYKAAEIWDLTFEPGMEQFWEDLKVRGCKGNSRADMRGPLKTA